MNAGPGYGLWLSVLSMGLPTAAFAQESAETLLARAKSVLAQVDGELKLRGLKARVDVLRDRWGIPHIDAQNADDLFFAQGFVAAQDRLFQLDLWRRIGLGETAELFGDQAIEADRFARLIRYRGDMDAEWQSYSPDAREIATAFTNGINAAIDQFGANLPLEFQVLGYSPKKWRPEDILARMSGLIMVSNWQREVTRARLIAEVGLERARQLAPTDPLRDFAPAPELDLSALTTDIFQGYTAATRPLRFQPNMSESNNWVIDGTMSTSGKPMLASDPHRALAVPSLRYLVHLHAPGWNVIGAGEPALPGVAIGHNEHVAWGITIVGTDQADLYVEATDPTDPQRYKVGDTFEPMQIVREALRVRGRSEAASIELRFTRHGPVIYQDEKRHIAVALKWVGSEPGGAAYLRSLAVARTKNVDELAQSLHGWKVPALNFVYADVAGNIGWTAAGGTPVRKGWDGLLPVPGASGQYEWQGLLPGAELPQLKNPTKHWVATANHNILPVGYSHEIAYEWSAPYRYLRIEQRLTAQRKFTLEDFQSIQHDSTSLPGQSLSRVLRRVPLPAELAPFAKLITDWDGHLSRESSAGPLYAAWLQELMDSFFADRFPKDARMDRGDLRNVSVMLAQLADPQVAWYGSDPVRSRDELVHKTFTKAVARTRKLLGDDVSQWRWGQLHTASFPHPLGSFGPAFQQVFNLGPVPRTGDVYTPNNTRHDENFNQVHGASYRHVLDLADWDRGLATSTPGQSGQPGSPHYGDLLPLWAEGTYFPLAFSRRMVEDVTEHRLMLTP